MIFIEICSTLLEIRHISCEEQGGRAEVIACMAIPEKDISKMD